MRNNLLDLEDVRKERSQSPGSQIKEVNLNDIAIIGMSGKFPLSDDINQYWSSIANKTECFRDIPQNRKADIENFLKKHGNLQFERMPYLNEIDKFDYKFFGISPNEASLIDPHQRLFLETACQAIYDAGYSAKFLKGSKTGVYVGLSRELIYTKLLDQVIPSSYPVYFPLNLSSYISGRVSHFFELNGPSMVINTACSSSLVALHYACKAIQSGECDMAIAGSVSINLFPVEDGLKLSIESSSNKVKTFDANADGTSFGEGVASIILKPLYKAIEDRDSIYAIIKGSAVNHDGRSIGITAPNPKGQEDVLCKAWKDAGVNPETITYIEAHGTGTQLGDPIEIQAIQNAFEHYTEKKSFCAVSSVKPNIGHLDCSSGIAGLIKAVLALKNKKLPPSINFTDPNSKMNLEKSPLFINTELEDWITDGSPRRCGVSNFGMSGTNCHVILEEAQHTVEQTCRYSKLPFIFTLSSKSERSLQKMIIEYFEFLNKNSSLKLEDVCFTLNIGRDHLNYRLAILTTSISDLIDKLKLILNTDLGSIEFEDIYYNKFQIIHTKKNNLVKREITDKEIKELNYYVNKKFKSINSDNWDNNVFLNEICTLYVKGAEIDWELLYINKSPRKLNLPGYLFERTRCWIEIPSDYPGKNYLKHESINQDYYDSLLSNVSWKPEDLRENNSKYIHGGVLILLDEKGTGSKLAKMYRSIGRPVFEVRLGKAYKRISTYELIITGDSKDFGKLSNLVIENGITQIIDLFSYSSNVQVNTIEELNFELKKSLYNLLHFTKSLIKSELRHEIELLLVSDYVNEVTGNEEYIKPEKAPMFGLGKVIGQESALLKCRSIDIDSSVKISDIFHELNIYEDKYCIAYRNEKRYVEIFEKKQLIQDYDESPMIKEKGVYIITGGLGGIGLEVCKYLSSKNKVRMALINRTGLPKPEVWDDILNKGRDKKLCNKINTIRDIERNGSEIISYSADVSNLDEMKSIILDLKRKYHGINGIIHSAGVATGGLVVNKSEEMFNNVVNPKVQGTWILDHLTKEENLDFFINFSSITSLLGGPGQSDYTAANSFLDSFAYYRSKQGKRTITINWPGWKEVGMASDQNMNLDSIFKVIDTKTAIDLFDKILSSNVKRVTVGEVNPDKVATLNERQEIKLIGKEEREFTKSEREIAQVWASVLGLNELSIYDDFFELGGNSLIAIKMELELQNSGIPIKFSDFEKHRTIVQLAALIDNNEIYMNIKEPIVETKQESFDSNIGTKNRLSNIKPFNDLFYKNCFYNSLFPIIESFGNDIVTFMVNDVIIYKYEEISKKLTTKYVQCKEVEDLMLQEGVQLNTKKVCENVVTDLKNSIDKGMPAVIWIDSYYESIRKDTYKNENLAHTILVYGYNDTDQTFDIIEHKHKDQLNYEHQILSYGDLYNSYNGYLNRFSNEEDTFYSFYPIKFKSTEEVDKTNDKNSSIFIKNMKKMQSNLLEGIGQVDNFKNQFTRIAQSELELSECADILLSGFNEILNSKEVEKYKLSNISLENERINEAKSILENIINNWKYVRAVLAKFIFSKVYSRQSVGSIVNKLEKICELEYEYIKILIKNDD